MLYLSNLERNSFRMAGALKSHFFRVQRSDYIGEFSFLEKLLDSLICELQLFQIFQGFFFLQKKKILRTDRTKTFLVVFICKAITRNWCVWADKRR